MIENVEVPLVGSWTRDTTLLEQVVSDEGTLDASTLHNYLDIFSEATRVVIAKSFGVTESLQNGVTF